MNLNWKIAEAVVEIIQQQTKIKLHLYNVYGANPGDLFNHPENGFHYSDDFCSTPTNYIPFIVQLSICADGMMMWYYMPTNTQRIETIRLQTEQHSYLTQEHLNRLCSKIESITSWWNGFLKDKTVIPSTIPN